MGICIYRIALVDDDPAAAQATAEFLRNEGFLVELAESGGQGLLLIERGFDPDLIIVDMQLTDMKGLEFLEEIRLRSVHAPVIFQSADDRAAIIAAAMSLGADIYVRKPTPPSLLLAAIRRLARSPASRQSADANPTEIAVDPAALRPQSSMGLGCR